MKGMFVMASGEYNPAYVSDVYGGVAQHDLASAIDAMDRRVLGVKTAGSLALTGNQAPDTSTPNQAQQNG